MIKFTPTFIGVPNNPILIVGEKPGNTRNNITKSLVGNKTGDFVAEAIEDRTNIILTNVVNEQYEGKFDHKRGVADGILELIELIEGYKPRKIICLGAIARDYVSSIKHESKLWMMPHPSYINRFLSSERDDFIKSLRNELDK